MRASLLWVLRACGGLLFGVIGWSVADLLPTTLVAPFNTAVTHIVITLLFGLIGLYVLPIIAARPAYALIDRFTHATPTQLLADVIGLVVGLLISVLLTPPLSYLPDPFRQVMPFLTAIIFAYLGIVVMSARHREFFAAFNFRGRSTRSARDERGDIGGSNTSNALDLVGGANIVTALPDSRDRILLDTNVIIDGRIMDIASTGFLRSELIIPRFVLNELQFIADDTDTLRRSRGRRGLEVMRKLQSDPLVISRLVDDDVPTVRQVDEKLIALAKQWNCPIMTNDYNLNKVASLQGVMALNINELANALKQAMIPGERVTLQIMQEGKEMGQGIGYLEDGTMIVVEDGRRNLNKTVTVTVTKVLQTAAGRMIFAK